MNKDTILFVDDKQNIRDVFSTILKNKEFNVITCGEPEKILDVVKKVSPELIISDIKMPKVSGIELVKIVGNYDKSIPVILITAYGSISSAVEAMKLGAYDYLTKPIDYDRLKVLIKRILDQKRLRSENKYLKTELEHKYSLNNILGKNEDMQKIFKFVKTVSAYNSSILIQGECGTGKELIAKAIHYNSPRKDKPMVIIDCSALPDDLLESELFGYEKGAFTGAMNMKKGRVELADGGTLFLDEIGEMSQRLQAKLLRLLQEKQFVRIGGLETIDVDFRLIASTNRNLKKEMSSGNFRSDLYYRLNVIKVYIPPLRNRKDDIPLLISYFIEKCCRNNNLEQKKISFEVMNCLLKYDWPGNVRELENCIERLVVVCPDETITMVYLQEDIQKTEYTSNFSESLKKNYCLNEIEKLAILNALRKANWNKTRAAKLLEIDRKALYTRIKKYQINKDK